MTREPFSARHNYVQPKPITSREEAPERVRLAAASTAMELGLYPNEIRFAVASVLGVIPGRSSCDIYDAFDLVENLEWFEVYDLIEKLHHQIVRRDEGFGQRYTEAVNQALVTAGIGWKLENGRIVMRGDDAFEATVTKAETALAVSGRPTAATEIKEALTALSRRPEPNIIGAARHAVAALECVARDVTGDVKATFGEVLKRHPGLVPKPLDEALAKIWGYASNDVRHGREAPQVGRAEAELLIGLCASVCSYLVRGATP